uniref:CAAX prenyl protease 2/Lysostaphin resistance protein A-like domain-containing protein n=1 Tax=Aegilops tauschii subsp. strangulata TaxID=200361 RepID=A0A453SA54_AEGTS
LESLDYIVVACLPGISEEFLFRGALMPIFGLNWISALATGVFFGVLHLGNGRRYSFAIWGNICWPCLWLSNHSFLKHHSPNGFSLHKQYYWRFTLALQGQLRQRNVDWTVFPLEQKFSFATSTCSTSIECLVLTGLVVKSVNACIIRG